MEEPFLPPDNELNGFPSAPEIEKELIGACLTDNNLIDDVAHLPEEAFYDGKMRHLWTGVTRLRESGEKATGAALINEMRQHGLLEEIGGAPTIMEVTGIYEDENVVKQYAEQLIDLLQQRKLIQSSQKLADDAYQPGDRRGEFLIDSYESTLTEIRDLAGAGKTISTAKDAAREAVEWIESMRSRDEGIRGVSTGFIDIDSIWSGMPPGEHIVMAARPGVGKTAMMLNIIDHVALKMQLPVFVASLEMTQQQLMLRLFASSAKIDISTLSKGHLPESDLIKLMETAERYADAPIYFDQSSDITIQGIRAKARQLKRKHDIALVAVDYLQLVQTTNKKASDLRTTVESVSNESKQGARELNIPWLSLAQLNRQVEYRKDRPKLADLRESGAIEQDADIVALMSRPQRDKEEEDSEWEHRKNITTVDTVKNRNGPVRSCEVLFRPQYTRFETMTSHEPEYEPQPNGNRHTDPKYYANKSKLQPNQDSNESNDSELF